MVERQVLCTGTSGAPLTARNHFLVIVGDEQSSFKEGHVASICMFGTVRPDTGAASDATHWRVRWCRVKPHLEYNGSILCGGL
jgi:hypothetical protein